MKPVPLEKIIEVLEEEARTYRLTRRWWRAKVFEQAASLLRKTLPT